MNMLLKQAMMAAVLGTAIAANAQYSSPGSTSAPASGATTMENRVPANRDSDAVKACANVAAIDQEACIARENARLGTGKNMGGNKGGGQASGAAQGNSSAGPGSTGTGTSGGATGGTGATGGAAGGTGATGGATGGTGATGGASGGTGATGGAAGGDSAGAAGTK